MKKKHSIEINEMVLLPEDGLLLGNGDISVSIYQKSDRIIWRFGKGDVWDRRLDSSKDPEPAHIDEIARGIEKEGWARDKKSGKVAASRGTSDPQRMEEIAEEGPPSYSQRPYPCPKPVGELSMHIPADHTGMEIRQRLSIEEALVEISCRWPSGLECLVKCFIPPSENILFVNWLLFNWDSKTMTHPDMSPVWFSLSRHADPDIEVFAEEFEPFFRNGYAQGWRNRHCTPLPPPVSGRNKDLPFIRQDFPPDPLFPRGFSYSMALYSEGAVIREIKKPLTKEACIYLEPPKGTLAGDVIVAIVSNSINSVVFHY